MLMTWTDDNDMPFCSWYKCCEGDSNQVDQSDSADNIHGNDKNKDGSNHYLLCGKQLNGNYSNEKSHMCI